MYSATARVGSNIAFIKYWGVADPSINIPLNNSISMTLADAYTTTTVRWDAEARQSSDVVRIDGKEVGSGAYARAVEHLGRLRILAGVPWYASIDSENNFPMASGIASSASGFAALTVAGCAALDLDLTSTQLSALARLGSGSASRSVYGGFVEWDRGHDNETSVARQLFPASHWALCDVVAVVSSAEKRVSSAGGHRIAATSPLNQARVASLGPQLEDVRSAIAKRDLGQLGPIIELDALAMHSVMMTGNPSLMYLQPGSLEIMHAVRRWREEDGLPVYFTIDAGPNIHLICERENADAVAERAGLLNFVERVIVSGPGNGPVLLEQSSGVGRER